MNNDNTEEQEIILSNEHFVEIEPFISSLNSARENLKSAMDDMKLAKAEHEVFHLKFWNKAQKAYPDVVKGQWQYIEEEQKFIKKPDGEGPDILKMLLGGLGGM